MFIILWTASAFFASLRTVPARFHTEYDSDFLGDYKLSPGSTKIPLMTPPVPHGFPTVIRSGGGAPGSSLPPVAEEVSAAQHIRPAAPGGDFDVGGPDLDIGVVNDAASGGQQQPDTSDISKAPSEWSLSDPRPRFAKPTFTAAKTPKFTTHELKAPVLFGGFGAHEQAGGASASQGPPPLNVQQLLANLGQRPVLNYQQRKLTTNPFFRSGGVTEEEGAGAEGTEGEGGAVAAPPQGTASGWAGQQRPGGGTADDRPKWSGFKVGRSSSWGSGLFAEFRVKNVLSRF